MRILFWNHLFLPHIGGVEIFTARLAGGLIARGHEVAVATSRYSDGLAENEDMDGIDVHRFDFLRALVHSHRDSVARLGLIKGVTTAVAAMKRSFRPDVVHVNLADASPFFHLRTLSAHICPAVVTFQAALQRPSSGADNLTGAIIAEAVGLVANSHFTASNVATFTGVAPEVIDVIFPGVPPAEFGPRDDAGAQMPPTIAFIGRLVPEKGAHVAIEALAHLPDMVRLRIIGDGVERSRLEALAQARGVAERVYFTGEVDNAERWRLMSTSSALVVPSLHEELFGMVAVEGALCGLPVAASATGGLQEIVKHGQTGFLSPRGDVAALTRHLVSLIQDPALARHMGEAGRKEALAHYTIERTIEAYERLYRRCADAMLANHHDMSGAR